MNPLAGALRAAMVGSPHDLVVLDRDTDTWQRRPWPEVHGIAEQVAAYLLSRDQPGAVGLVGEPTVELIAAIQGSWLAGAGVSILPRPQRGADPSEWARATLSRFSRIGVTTVFSYGVTLELLRDAGMSLTVSDIADAARTSTSGQQRYPDSADVAILQGTAGSTGSPRTAVLRPEAVLNNILAVTQRLSLGRNDVGCSWLPIYHDMGLAMVLTSTMSGGSLWLAPTGAFSAAPLRWADWLSESGATLTAGPNFGYSVLGRFANRVSDVDLGAVRIAINGGEPVDCAGVDRFAIGMSRFGFDAAAMTPSYGMAESTCAVTIPAPGEGLRIDIPDAADEDRRYALLGRPVPGMEIRIVPSSHDESAAVGEVEIRGSSMMTSYLGDAPVDAGTGGEWFPTGDIGYLVDGALVICGRSKEIITIAGRNIFPTEIEQVVGEVDGVREGAVVAVGTESGAAQSRLLVAAEFIGTEQDATRSAVIRRIVSVCGVTPADVVLMSPGSLPRTSSGKLRRLEVRRQLEAAR
ncbi:long-chain-fatty acid--ACP ligase MbtM [Mycolicibacterium lutetiense]|uniref:Long-chain-fatty-acid--[acyl-carrier-protein] ligase n=1 Tax=Mycolicibacterium lutetiense TaxID=1641992 RepID=A0ABS4ZNY3_9MYCO|nr:long-chain-fatty acid--ACP ligase MbtM [Mycolicibacterium lutetiense]MBP2451188.1 long-chain-fatty-acid--[acyl-carrier-protein] ligase [Mycolicibacterium lutetiense]